MSHVFQNKDDCSNVIGQFAYLMISQNVLTTSCFLLLNTKDSFSLICEQELIKQDGGSQKTFVYFMEINVFRFKKKRGFSLQMRRPGCQLTTRFRLQCHGSNGKNGFKLLASFACLIGIAWWTIYDVVFHILKFVLSWLLYVSVFVHPACFTL